MVELRKRKTPPPAAEPARKKSTASKGSKVAKAKEAVKKVLKPSAKEEEPAAEAPVAAASGPPAIGSTIDLASFGGEVETHDGNKVTLAKLVEESKAGVVIFTYPKQNTPGCTKQACLFRDEYTPLTSTGLSIYGLSTDAPKGNTSFKNKFSFPYTLLCDPKSALIKPLGFAKSPIGSANRGVFVVSKTGEVLANKQATPDGSVDIVRKIVTKQGGGFAAAAGSELQKEPTQEEKETADNAAEVADTAAKLDGTPQPVKA